MNDSKIYDIWLNNAKEDIDLIKELNQMDEKTKEDAFYKDLEFGTGGLRGVIGAGTNRMNIYTVSKATQGIANYINGHVSEGKRKVAISYDSRLKSIDFALMVARVLSGNGIQAFIYPNLSPVPTLSYATRYLGCAFGIMITASHNPSKYNGYKVYGEDGCQITDHIAKILLDDIEKINPFSDVKKLKAEDGFNKGLISYILPGVLTSFLEEVKKQSQLYGESIDKSASIIYTPLNGTGLVPVKRILEEEGYTNIEIVKEQEFPNGYFPTCPYPNPEIKEAMALGIKYAKEKNADLLIATDPDCDRVGIAVKDKAGEFRLLTGNETFLLLFDYICQRRIQYHKMPKNPILVKTIVTTDLVEKIAKHYHVEVINVLTGFKYIGEQISKLEKKNEENRFIFGFEESYGCLSGTYVRDKDAVVGSMLIVEMYSYYRTKGITLLDKLNELYKMYGYCLNTLHSYQFEGKEGFDKMLDIMNRFKKESLHDKDIPIEKMYDYSEGINGLPKSNVLKVVLKDSTTFVVRPSGTELKLKLYFSIQSDSESNAKDKEQKLRTILEEKIIYPSTC